MQETSPYTVPTMMRYDPTTTGNEELLKYGKPHTTG